MSSDLYLGNKKFISAKDAASLTSYTSDYVGQLCRLQKVESKKIGRTWYVREDSILRHKQLGYSVQMLRHRQTATGPAIRSWLDSAFEPVKRTIDDIKRDYRQLIDTITEQTGARVLILNRMSTSGFEDITSYSSFDAPLGDTLENISAKEMNLMLHDLADDRDFSIDDVDAIAAYLGGAENLPDGIHHSAEMQSLVRSEIIHILNDVN